MVSSPGASGAGSRVVGEAVPADRAAAAAREVRRVIGRITDLQDEAVAESLRRLEDLRDAVSREIGAAGGTRLSQLRRLRQGIERLGGEYARRAGQDLSRFAAQGWDLGQDLVDEPLRAVGIRVGTLELPRSVFEAATEYSLNLIGGLADDAVRAVQRQILLGATGVKSPTDVLAAIGKSLDSPGVFRSIAARAEAIGITELGRIQSLATDGRLQSSARVVRGLRKAWAHGAVRAQSRPNHFLRWRAGVNGQIRDANEPFDIPGGRNGAEQGMFPRDPGLSAGNSVHCRCQSVPWHEDWGEDQQYMELVQRTYA